MKQLFPDLLLQHGILTSWKWREMHAEREDLHRAVFDFNLNNWLHWWQM